MKKSHPIRQLQFSLRDLAFERFFPLLLCLKICQKTNVLDGAKIKRLRAGAEKGSEFGSLEMKFFLINFLVTLIAYGLTSFVYPSEGTVLPRIFLMWGAPILGTMVAWWVSRVSLLARAFAAQALAIYTVTGIYCLVYHQKAIFDTLQYVTTAYLIPGAILALLAGIFGKSVIR